MKEKIIGQLSSHYKKKKWSENYLKIIQSLKKNQLINLQSTAGACKQKGLFQCFKPPPIQQRRNLVFVLWH